MVRLRSPAPYFMGEFPSGQRGQTVNLLSLTSLVRIQLPPPKNTAEKDTFSAVFFYPSRRLGISSALWGWISSRLWRVYHHRRCIPLRLDDILARKRDILVFGRMICNFCEIDDIQGSRLDFS